MRKHQFRTKLLFSENPNKKADHLEKIRRQLTIQYKSSIDFESFFSILRKTRNLDTATLAIKKTIGSLIHSEVLSGTVPILKGWLIMPIIVFKLCTTETSMIES